MTELTVLLVEDNIELLEQLKDQLNSSFQKCLAESSYQAANKIIHNNKIDLLITDLNLPGEKEGLKLFQTLNETNPLASKVLMSSFIDLVDEEEIINQVQINRFLAKPFSMPFFKSTILDLKKKILLESENTLLKNKLHIDPLTQLYRKDYFNGLIEAEVQRAHRFKRSLCLAFLDLDFFKKINDNLGHKEGDQALINLAQMFLNQKRPSDSIARFGGDEFLILMPESSLKGAKSFISRLQETSKQNLNLSFSAGIAELSSVVNSTEKLKEAADLALIECKKTKKGSLLSYKN